ncbi:MAG: ABC transporter ATP-binding protein [Rhodospirillaceae bacterium]|nr:ABC transporter ATP-binding protein [Rhodospirillaceae bacterium]MDG1273440.1 ABC transporter ATP-binding protein [Alphaproteobacteria bacterium]MDG1887758.1 ABC transporter ATP-binding protein [Alphaproteobacteria bacterium]
MPQLEVNSIHTSYGLSQVLFGISLSVEPGQVISLIGRNGVGKTTTMRSIIGLTPTSSGKIIFQGTDITKLPAYKISRLGVGFVPEERRIFPQLSVWENLDIARRPAISGEGWDEERVFTLFPDLKDIQARPGGVLSGGQQQMLTIARTLMNNPSILLLDEPSEGLAPKVVEDLRDQVKLLKDTGLSIILAEQNLKFVLYLSDYCHILEKGEIKYSGSPEDLRAKPEILEQYLTL